MSEKIVEHLSWCNILLT